MNKTQVRLDLHTLLIASGQPVSNTNTVMQVLEKCHEQGGCLNRQDRRNIAELLPQTSNLWSNDLQQFIFNLHKGAEATAKAMQGYEPKKDLTVGKFLLIVLAAFVVGHVLNIGLIFLTYLFSSDF